MPTPTHAVPIFIESCKAIAANTAMIPRSKDDKEHFPQDWFADRVSAIGLPLAPQGRNSYPDFWVGDAGHGPEEGFEIKSLSFTKKGKPARKDYDSNSTIPSGRKDNRDVFLVFFLYTGSGANPRPVHTLVIAHTDLVNADHAVAAAHVNEAIHGFGTYGEGFIRNRKMYVFPHPIQIDPTGIGRTRLIVPTSWKITDNRLKKVSSIKRTIAPTSLVGYSVHLDGITKPNEVRAPRLDAGHVAEFDVFEPQ